MAAQYEARKGVGFYKIVRLSDGHVVQEISMKNIGDDQARAIAGLMNSAYDHAIKVATEKMLDAIWNLT